MPTGNPTLPKEVTTSPTASESQLENQMSPRIMLEKGLPPGQVRWWGTEEPQLGKSPFSRLLNLARQLVMLRASI